jgi:hypothetical protein
VAGNFFGAAAASKRAQQHFQVQVDFMQKSSEQPERRDLKKLNKSPGEVFLPTTGSYWLNSTRSRARDSTARRADGKPLH